MLRTSDLEYPLPPEAVATTPAEPRDAARLMVISRSDASVLEHAHVRDLARFLRRGDRLVLNTTRVLAARLEGVRVDTGGKVGGLYLHRASPSDGWTGAESAWVCLLTGKSLREGIEVRFEAPHASLTATLIARTPGTVGGWIVRLGASEGFDREATRDDDRLLARIGHTPLPPYIMKARKEAGREQENASDLARYQTVYAREAGSVAAPTAGLHLTPELFARLASIGVDRSDVLLHVGTGTFRSVETEFVEEHPMHGEWCSMTREARDGILTARASGGRVVCVGTTSVRTVESFAKRPDLFEAGAAEASMETRLLITPGCPFLWTDGLLTNFHLPRSTLLALVGAMLPEGLPRLKELYAGALEAGYRFFSYGDAMLILP